MYNLSDTYAALPLNFTAVVLDTIDYNAVPPFRRSPFCESKKINEKNFDFKVLHGARWNPCGVLTSTFLFFFFRAPFGRFRKGRTARRPTILSLWHPRYATEKGKKKEKKKTRACHTEQTGRRMVIC